MFHIRESIYTTIGNDAMDEEDFPLDASIESVDIVNQNGSRKNKHGTHGAYIAYNVAVDTDRTE